MLFFDHSYTNDLNHQFLNKLKKSGFTLMEHEVEHPGKKFCRFISFNGKNFRKYQYLEFVNVKKDGVKCTRPGISFGYSKNLWGYFNKLKNKFEVEFKHKNYEWKKNNKNPNNMWNIVITN